MLFRSEKYNKRFKKRGTYYSLKSEQEIEACKFAQQQLLHPQTISIQHLDSSVNTPFSEFAAVENDSMIYFSSSKEKTKSTKKTVPHSAIYIFDEQKKSLQTTDTAFVKNSTSIGNIAFSKDGKKCFYTECKNTSPTETHCEIYFRAKENGKWTVAKKLSDNINMADFTATQPSFASVDSLGDVLFFASNRPGGEGKMDIWASVFSSDGNFGNPFNLGKKINSIDNEITPYFNDSTQTLFYSSDWHKGMGGFDIFKTKRKNKSFETAVNLGYPINSSYNDLYYTTNATETKSYFSSNRQGSYFDKFQNCCNDIYAYQIVKRDSVIKTKPLPIPVVETKKDTVIKIVNQLKLLVPLTLYFDNDQPDSKTLKTSTNKSYNKIYETYLGLKNNYKTEYSKGLLSSKKLQAEQNIELLFTDSVMHGMQQLQKFASLLSQILPEGEQVKITLKGYCSPLASSDYNKNLARRRISCVRNYFAEYNNGELKSYIITPTHPSEHTGNIEFTEEEIGELKASTSVSDDLRDKKNSVYSPSAALERKIQIIAISSK